MTITNTTTKSPTSSARKASVKLDGRTASIITGAISRKQRPITCACEHAVHLDIDGGHHPLGARVVFVVRSWDSSGRLVCQECNRSHASRGLAS